jgi:oligopeptidase A
MDVTTENPLVRTGRTIPFDRIAAEHVVPAITQLLAESRAALDAIESTQAPPTYASTLEALEQCTEHLDLAMTVVGHLESVASTPALREAYNQVKPEVSAFYASISLRPELYARLKSFAATDEAAALSPTRRRFLDKTLDEFRRHGAELDDAGKARLEALSRELAVLTNRFSQNVLDATNAFELIVEDEGRLAGLPESARVAARDDAEARGKSGYRFTLHAPSLIPLLTYLDDRALRRDRQHRDHRRDHRPQTRAG